MERQIREADHFGNLPNTDAYFELREKGKLPEPTHRDVLPHLEDWEEDEVFDSFRDWWKDLEEAGLITDHNRWHEKTTSLVKVPVDRLVAGQKFTAGPTFSTGPGNVWPMPDGRYAIIDGHHRIVRQVLDGATEVEVLLPDVTLPDRTWSVLTDDWHEDLDDEDDWSFTAQHQNLRTLTDEGEADEYWEPYHEDQTLHDLGKPWPDENRFEDHDSLLFYGKNEPGIRIEQKNRGDRVIFELRDGQRVVGRLKLEDDGDHWKVYDAEVEEDYQGQGHGKALYDAALDWAKEHGTWVMPDSSVADPARKIWHRMFRDPSVKRDFVGPQPYQTLFDRKNKPEHLHTFRKDELEDVPDELQNRYRRADHTRRPPPHPGRRSGAAGDTKRGGAGVLLVDEDGRVFLGRRAEGSAEPGTWSPPGGGVENGEGPAEAARRELREEFGLEVEGSLNGPWTVTRPDGFEFATFLADGSADMVPDMDESEHSDCGWFELSDLPQPLHPGFEALLDVLLSARLEAGEGERSEPEATREAAV
jgi:8-oxo-dGTP pyrophosphatase MutT (NUDIX family)/GNAT superfamily N-acetyltransferase